MSLENGLAVVGELGDAFADIVQGLVALFFLEFREFRVPAEGEFLDGTYVDVPVAEPVRDVRHVLVQETPVLRDGIAAEHVLRLLGIGLDEVERHFLGIGSGVARMAATVHEPACGMVRGVPFVHRFEHVFALVYGDDRPFGEDVQVRVGDDGRDFQNDVFLGIEPGHLEVHPDQVGRMLLCCHSNANLAIFNIDEK